MPGASQFMYIVARSQQRLDVLRKPGAHPFRRAADMQRIALHAKPQWHGNAHCAVHAFAFAAEPAALFHARDFRIEFFR